MLLNCEHEDCCECLELAEACSGLRFNNMVMMTQVAKRKSLSLSLSGSRSWSLSWSGSWSWSWSSSRFGSTPWSLSRFGSRANPY